MPKFVVEREIPGAGKLSPEEFRGVAHKVCAVLREMGPQVQWIEGHVTDDKVYCMCIAPDEAALRGQSKRAGFPASRVSEVRRMIDPTTSEG